MNKTVSEMAVVERTVGTIRILWRPSTKSEGDMVASIPRGANIDDVEMKLTLEHMRRNGEGIVQVIRPGRKDDWNAFAVWMKSVSEEDIWEI